MEDISNLECTQCKKQMKEANGLCKACNSTDSKVESIISICWKWSATDKNPRQIWLVNSTDQASWDRVLRSKGVDPTKLASRQMYEFEYQSLNPYRMSWLTYRSWEELIEDEVRVIAHGESKSEEEVRISSPYINALVELSESRLYQPKSEQAV